MRRSSSCSCSAHSLSLFHFFSKGSSLIWVVDYFSAGCLRCWREECSLDGSSYRGLCFHVTVCSLEDSSSREMKQRSSTGSSLLSTWTKEKRSSQFDLVVMKRHWSALTCVISTFERISCSMFALLAFTSFLASWVGTRRHEERDCYSSEQE